jgi:hypothetical protein
MKLRINNDIVRDLEAALASARLDSCAVKDEHKQAMKHYLDSWVVAYIEHALDSIKTGAPSILRRR